MSRLFTPSRVLLLAGSLLPGAALAQMDQLPVQSNQQQSLAQNSLLTLSGRDQGLPSSVTIPAGTRVMMVLTSPLHTTSGTEGSGIYLETLYPLVQSDRVVIPAHTQVQGAVESNKRSGHVQRTAGFKFHFTTLIFPNNHVVSINGALQSIPGSGNTRVQRDSGTLRTVDQTERVVIPAAAGAASGALFGSVNRFGIGTYVGAGLGAGLGLGSVLLHRGDAISLRAGTTIEMVLESQLDLDPEQVAFNAQYVPAPRSRREAHEDQPQSSPKNRSRRRPARLRWPGLLFAPQYERR